MQNQTMQNQTMQNQTMQNQSMQNQSMQNQSMLNQSILNQSTYNPIHYNRHNLFPNTLQSYNNNNNNNNNNNGVNNHPLTSRIPEQTENTINSTIPIHNTTNNNHDNEGINIRRHSTPNPLPFTNIYNVNSLPIHTPINPPFTSNSSINSDAPLSNILSENNIDINGLINNMIHPTTTTPQTTPPIHSLPYGFEISNFGPIGTGFISTITTNNSQIQGIPLSTINLITNVTRNCDHLNNNNNNNNNDICSICQIAFTDTTICRVIKNCNHIFHINCIDTWLHDHTTCPFCRYDLLNITIPNENGGEGVEGVGENSEDSGEEDYEEEDYEEDDKEYEEDADYEEEAYEESDSTTEVIMETPTTSSPPSLPSPLETNVNETSHPSQIPNLSENIINTEPMLNDINTFISMSTPFINNFINQRVPNSNTSSRLNSDQINSQINNSVNQFVNQLNPLLQSFNNFGNRN